MHLEAAGCRPALLKLRLPLESSSELIRLEIWGPCFQELHCNELGRAQEPSSLAPIAKDCALELGKTASFPLNSDCSFDYKTSNVSMVSLFLGLSVVKNVQQPPGVSQSVIVLSFSLLSHDQKVSAQQARQALISLLFSCHSPGWAQGLREICGKGPDGHTGECHCPNHYLCDGHTPETHWSSSSSYYAGQLISTL